MDPNTQLDLDDLFKRFSDEMQRQIGDLDTKPNYRFGDIEHRQDTRFQVFENPIMQASTEFES